MEIERLKAWFESSEKQINIELLAHSDITFISQDLNISNKSFENTWIINLEVTNHMTNTCKYFFIYILCVNNKKIIIIYYSLGIITCNMTLILALPLS